MTKEKSMLGVYDTITNMVYYLKKIERRS